MKICPKCGTSFDDSQTFCLNDGTVLNQDEHEEATVYAQRLSSPHVTVPPAAGHTNGPNKWVIYSFMGLVLVILTVFGGIFIWSQFLRNNNDKPVSSFTDQPSTENKSTPTPTPLNTPSVTVATEKALPPIQRSNPNATKYSGRIGNSNAVFSLVWHANKTVSGTYYFVNNPNQIYTVSGTNYTAGNLELQDGNSSIRMTKSIKGNTLCWNGVYYSNNSSSEINFCRYR